LRDDLISFLTWFNHAVLESNQTLTNTRLSDRFMVRERKGEFLNFGDQDFETIIPGREYKKYWLNIENGLINNYSTIHHDSTRSRFYFLIQKIVWEVKETNFKFLYSQKIPENNLFVTGKIENPLSNKVHLKVLDDPFDIVLKTKTVLLDEGGNFSVRFDFSHAGFVYVENENNNKHNPPGTYVFYAEPGDTIHFESTGTELPWRTVVSGSRPEEQRLIQELRQKIRILDSSRSLANYSKEIFDREIYFFNNPEDSEIREDKNLNMLFQAINDAEEIVSNYEARISEKALHFILNETKSYFYSGILQYAQLAFRKDFGTNPRLGREETRDYIKKIDQLDIHKVYNDYGLHSRQCVFNYLNYHSSQISKVKYWYSAGTTVHVPTDPKLNLQFSRLLVTGSPLYREIGRMLVQIIERRSHLVSSKVRDDYYEDFVLHNLDLLLKKCNDREMTEKVIFLIFQFKKLQKESYVPEIDFLDINGKTAAYKDFLGKKPTIFYFSSNWVGDRYEYDMMGEGMPEINFVMVVEGSNFEQWKEYTNRAQPAITHLLFLNDSVTFRDIFQKNSIHLVFDKNGEFVGRAWSPKEAAQKAVESLEAKKKELNRSQLIMIIAALGVVLVAFLIGVLIWKWRVRKRLRTEEQKRRLRELELTAIRSQMNPHFLFNCLNSVQNLVQQNKGREAHLYLSDFAGLIRKVLQNSEKEEVSLAEELEMVQQYLNLEKLRFDFNFQITTGEGIDPHNTPVPSMLLQPFAENAVIHGLQNKVGERMLKIEVLKENEQTEHTRLAVDNRLAHKASKDGVLIIIEDNGIGRAAAQNLGTNKNGKGSKLMQERLEILQEKQGEKYRLQITDLNENSATGTRVEIWVPEEK
jgi:hypothetical protein